MIAQIDHMLSTVTREKLKPILNGYKHHYAHILKLLKIVEHLHANAIPTVLP
jgi:hypothetical protein